MLPSLIWSNGFPFKKFGHEVAVANELCPSKNKGWASLRAAFVEAFSKKTENAVQLGLEGVVIGSKEIDENFRNDSIKFCLVEVIWIRNVFVEHYALECI